MDWYSSIKWKDFTFLCVFFNILNIFLVLKNNEKVIMLFLLISVAAAGGGDNVK
jgi:hypothetical protein